MQLNPLKDNDDYNVFLSDSDESLHVRRGSSHRCSPNSTHRCSTRRCSPDLTRHHSPHRRSPSSPRRRSPNLTRHHSPRHRSPSSPRRRSPDSTHHRSCHQTNQDSRPPATHSEISTDAQRESAQDADPNTQVQVPPPIRPEFSNVDTIFEMSGWVSPTHYNNWRFNLPSYLVSEGEGLHVQGITVSQLAADLWKALEYIAAGEAIPEGHGCQDVTFADLPPLLQLEAFSYDSHIQCKMNISIDVLASLDKICVFQVYVDLFCHSIDS